MTRTQLLQEIRRMRFVDAYVGWQARRLTQGEAARLLGVCDRTFRRYVDRYEDEGLDGLDGLVDKRLGQVSARRVRVHRYRDGHLAVFHGPRKLADYTPEGASIGETETLGPPVGARVAATR